MISIKKNHLLYDLYTLILLLNFSSIYQIQLKFFFLISFFFLSAYIVLKNYHRASVLICKAAFLKILLFMLLYIPIQFFIYRNGAINYCVFICKVIAIYLVSSIAAERDYHFITRVFEIFFILCIFYFILYILLTFGFPFKKVYYEGLYITIYSHLFAAAPSDMFNLYRFTGFFTEPGITQIILNLCLYYFLYVNKNLKKSIFLSICIILTFSVMGYLVLFFLWMYKFFFYSRKNLTWMVLFTFVLLVMMFMLIALIYIFSRKAQTDSFLIRFLDITVAFNCIYQHPFLGWGYVNEEIISEVLTKFLKKISLEGIHSGLSNGLLTIWVNMGVFFFFAYLYNLLKGSKKYMKESFFPLFFVLIFGLINEPLQYSLLYLVFILNNKNYSKKGLKIC